MPTGVYFHKKRLPFSEEWRKNMSNVQKGKKQSEEHKRKKANALKEFYANGGKTVLGKHWKQSEATRKRKSKWWKKYYANGGKHSMTGKKRSEETRRKISRSEERR